MKIRNLLIAGMMAVMIIGCGNATESTNETDSKEVSASEVKVTLGEYKGLETNIVLGEVTDDRIQEVVDATVEDNGGCYVDDPDGMVQDKSQVDVSYTIKGEEDSGQFSVQIGDGNTPTWLDDALKGAKVGDTVEATEEVTEGSDEHPHTYVCNIGAIRNPGEITDDFVANVIALEGINTVKELRESIREYIEIEDKKAFNEAVQKKALEMAIENATVEGTAQDIIDSYTQTINRNLDELVKYYEDTEEPKTRADIISEQMKEEDFVGSVDDFIKWISEKKAKEAVVCQEIAKKENIEVSDEELYSSIATDWAREADTYETLIDYLKVYNKENYERELIMKKVALFLGENSKEGFLSTDYESEGSASSENASSDASAESSSAE